MKILVFALSLLAATAQAAVPARYPLSAFPKEPRMIEPSNANEFYGVHVYNQTTYDASPYVEGNQVMVELPSGGGGIGFTQAVLVPTYCTITITRVTVGNPHPEFVLNFSINGAPLIPMNIGSSVTLLSGPNTIGWNSPTGGSITLQTNHSCTN